MKNYATLVMPGEGKATVATKALRHSPHHIILYADGSHHPNEYTGVTECCTDAEKSMSETLGSEYLNTNIKAFNWGSHFLSGTPHLAPEFLLSY